MASKHSKKFATVKKWYDLPEGNRAKWSIGQVAEAVLHGWITEEEFFEITGEIFGEVTEE